MNKNALTFILIVVCLDTLSFGIIYPVLPKLLEDITGTNLSKASIYGGWLTAIYALLQFLFSPIIGSLSDKFGRKPILLISLLALSIDCLFLAFAKNIVWFFVGRAIAGIAGASYSAAAASIADISNENNRTAHFGYINAAYSSGFIIGPAIGGILGDISIRLPFIFSAVICFLNFLFGVLLYKETLPYEKRRKLKIDFNTVVSGFLNLQKLKLIFPLLVALFFMAVSSHSMPSVWSYFTMEKFNWDTQLVGYSLAFLGILSLVVQTYGVKFFSKKFGDHKMTGLGILFSIFGLLLITFSFHPLLLIPALILYNIGSINRAGFQSIASKKTPLDQQGELQGTIASINSLATILAPLIMTNTFRYFTTEETPIYFPSAPYLIATFLSVVALIFFRTLK